MRCQENCEPARGSCKGPEEDACSTCSNENKEASEAEE